LTEEPRAGLTRGLIELADDFARAACEAAVWSALSRHATRLLGAEYAVVLRRVTPNHPEHAAFQTVFVPREAGQVAAFQSVATLTGRGLVVAPPAGEPGAAPFLPLFDALNGLAGGGVVYTQLNLREVLLLVFRDQHPRMDRLSWVLLETLALQASAALERVQGVRKVAELSLRDGPTGLGNRRLVEVVLERSFPQALRGDPLAVLVLRLPADHGVDPELTDQAGARALRPHVRESDVLARLDEGLFVAVLHACGSAGAELFASRVRADLPGALVRWRVVQPDSQFETAVQVLEAALADAQPTSSVDTPGTL
jgi:GGDEF domain-containing protein